MDVAGNEGKRLGELPIYDKSSCDSAVQIVF